MNITEIHKLPEKPGVYIYKDTAGKIIYIGKAKDLRKRVSSYFTRKSPDIKTAALVEHVNSLDYIVTDSETGALILEANLIQKHKPKYNIDLKDNKSYPFIKVTLNEPFPRVIKTRRVTDDGGKYFGPYTRVSSIYQGLEIIQRLFKIRTCTLKITGNKKLKPCLNYHIGRCSGPCTGAVSREDYRKVIDDVMILLSGKFDKLSGILHDRMKEASQKMEYEKAAFFRDQLKFIDEMNERQKVYTPDKKDRDVFGFHEAMNKIYYVILHFREGKLLGKRAYSAVDTDSRGKALADFITAFYTENEIPEEILLPHEIEDFDLVQQIIHAKAPAVLSHPQKGMKNQLVDMASNNAKYEFLKDKKLTEKEGVLVEIQNFLGMEKLPRRIECFDISNTDGTLAVGSMVSFFNGRPDKKNYRIFKIRMVEGPNDVGMIQETVSRRYMRVLNENLPLPDLILIDGGKGQVNAAHQIIQALEITHVTIIGLAKREEEIVFPGTEKDNVLLPRTSEGLKILQNARDEAHRFGITFHKKLRSKKMKFSLLDEIPGVGEKKKKKLMQRFKSIGELGKAGIEEIMESGVDKKCAESVFHFFQRK